MATLKKYSLNIALVFGFIFLVLGAQAGILDQYVLTVLMGMGINVIFAASLNLVNGYMGEFSCGHAGFMCIGAYTASLLSVTMFTNNKILGDALLDPSWAPFLFPLVLLAGGVVAALFGLVVALPSFKTRGDYLAIITIAANYIIISLIENLDFLGGPRGLQGMKKVMNAMRDVADIPWMLIWIILVTVASIVVLYRLVNSTYGKGIRAVCQDEVAAEIMGVNTNHIKMMAFMVSSGLAGVAGGLYAHLYGYINPQAFNILKSTEGLVMVYLGGMASLSGSVLAAILFTLLVEALRFVIPMIDTGLHAMNIIPAAFEISQVWKWVLIPLILILLMQFRPEGLLGNKELTDVFPKLKKFFTLKK